MVLRPDENATEHARLRSRGLLPTAELARRLGVSAETVRKRTLAGMPASATDSRGGRWYSPQDCDDWHQSHHAPDAGRGGKRPGAGRPAKTRRAKTRKHRTAADRTDEHVNQMFAVLGRDRLEAILNDPVRSDLTRADAATFRERVSLATDLLEYKKRAGTLVERDAVIAELEQALGLLRNALADRTAAGRVARAVLDAADRAGSDPRQREHAARLAAETQIEAIVKEATPRLLGDTHDAPQTEF